MLVRRGRTNGNTLLRSWTVILVYRLTKGEGQHLNQKDPTDYDHVTWVRTKILSRVNQNSCYTYNQFWRIFFGLLLNCTRLLLDSSEQDRSLTYRKHLESLSKKLTAWVGLLRWLAGSKWGSDDKTLCKDTITLIHSLLSIVPCLVSQQAHSPHWQAHTWCPVISDRMPSSYSNWQSFCLSRYYPHWASPKMSYTVSSLKCNGPKAPTLMMINSCSHQLHNNKNLNRGTRLYQLCWNYWKI